MAYKSYILNPSAGRGMISSRTTQSLKEYSDSWSFLQNFILVDDAFSVRPGDLGGVSAGDLTPPTGPVWGIHYYNSIDPSNAAATPTTLLLEHAGETTGGAGNSTLYDSYSGGTVVTVNGNNFVTSDPSDIFFLNIKNRCFVTGRKMGAGVVPTIIQRWPSHSSYQWGKAGPTAVMTYDAYTNATNANTKLYFTAAGAGVTNGSSNVTKAAGAAWDTAWAGKTALLDNVPYNIVSVTGAGGPMTISPNYAGTTATVNIRVDYGELRWPDNGPQYAYAYYDPVNGHVTNASPIMTISEHTQTDVRVKLSNIQLTNDSRFTRVIIFRTQLDGGSDLLPLRLDVSGTNPGSATIDTSASSAGYGMIVNNAVGSVTYVDFQADPELGQILGRVIAPTINNPPPSDAKYLAYWDERVWTVSAANPSQLVFSGSAAQIQLGVAEESFPALNFRAITSDDGAITGLKVVGSSLLVATNKYLHFVSGSNENDYVLQRVSSRGTGIDQYAFDEHPGDSSEQAASAIYLSSDKRLWRQYPGGRIEDIGWPIQDKLDRIDLNKTKPAIVKVFQVGKVCMLACGIRATGNTRYDYLFYDFDRQTWHDMGFATGIFGSDYVGWANAMWSGTASGITYSDNVSGSRSFHVGSDTTLFRLMLDSSVFVNGSAIATTQWIDFGEKEAKKTLQEVVLYRDATQFSDSWYVTAYFDDDETTGTALTPQDDSSSPRRMGSGVKRFVLPTTSLKNQFRVVKLKVQFTANVVGAKLYRVVVNYTIASTGASGAHA